MRLWVVAGAALLVSGCNTPGLNEEPGRLVGLWGGPHAGIIFQGGLGDVQFDCASGTIDGTVTPAPDGSFMGQGTYRTGTSGPVRVGQFFKSQRATYTGTVTDKTNMTLNVMLEDGTSVGPFTLVQNAPPQVTRCL